MIRVLVLMLVAANLLYLGWSQWIKEAEPRLVSVPTAPRKESVPAPAAPPPPPVCSTIGPFKDELRGLEVEQILRDMRLTPTRRSITEDLHDGWWVYVVTPNTQAQGRALRAIRGAGIRDAFSMPDDPQFRVSVGLFLEESRANSRAATVKALKLEATVSERIKQQTTYWYDLQGAAPAAVDLARLVAEGIETQALRVEACPAAPDEPPEAPADGASPDGAAAAGPAATAAPVIHAPAGAPGVAGSSEPPQV